MARHTSEPDCGKSFVVDITSFIRSVDSSQVRMKVSQKILPHLYQKASVLTRLVGGSTAAGGRATMGNRQRQHTAEECDRHGRDNLDQLQQPC